MWVVYGGCIWFPVLMQVYIYLCCLLCDYHWLCGLNLYGYLFASTCALICAGCGVGDASWDVALESTFARDVAHRRVRGVIEKT